MALCFHDKLRAWKHVLSTCPRETQGQLLWNAAATADPVGGQGEPRGRWLTRGCRVASWLLGSEEASESWDQIGRGAPVACSCWAGW